MMIGGHIIKALSQGPRVYKISAPLRFEKMMLVNTFTGIEITGSSKHCKCLTCCRCVSALWGQFPVNDDIMYG